MRRLLPAFQAFLRSLPGTHQQGATAVWTEARRIINTLEAERDAIALENEQNRDIIRRLGAQAAPPSSPQGPVPRTDSSVAAAIENWHDQMMAIGDELYDAGSLSEVQALIWDMPPDLADKHLQEARDPTTEHARQALTGVECWMKAPDANRYAKINLRNTTHHNHIDDSSVKYGKNIYLHHLAVVAAGRGEGLRVVVDRGEYHASHLCGNERCFRPDHVWVEPAEVNEARKSCQEGADIQCVCGNFYRRCWHRTMPGSCGKACILPVFEAAQHKCIYQGTTWGYRLLGPKPAGPS